MDAALDGGLELEDNSFVDKGRESLFEIPSGCERPCGGILSLDRDLRGDIGGGLGGHEALVRGEIEDEVEKEAVSSRELRRAPWCRGAFPRRGDATGN